MTIEEIKTFLSSMPVEKRRLAIHELREEFAHPLEVRLGVPADMILEAIARSSDLTQRGVRGVIAEAIFILEVLPKALVGTGWEAIAIAAGPNLTFDTLVQKERLRVRIQVKNQRSERGKPKSLGGQWVAEIQKTRSGERGGKKTRPYRFGDFDLLAVCMWPSTGNWKSFTYSLAADLKPRKKDRTLIDIMQRIPVSLNVGNWSEKLGEKLNEFEKRVLR